MTDLDLDAIKARTEEATRGPWRVGVKWEDPAEFETFYLPVNSPATDPENPHQPDRVALIRYHAGGFQYPHHDAKADAEFIAHARTDVPALIAEVERLGAGVTAALEWVATEYRQCIVSARVTCDGEHYARCNGRAEAYHQLADRVATAAGLAPPDWDQIRRDVPADGRRR